MAKSILASLVFIIVASCVQNKSSAQALKTNKRLVLDTNKIAILPVNTNDHRLFKDAKSMQLTNHDLKSIDKIINDCIHNYNLKQDTTKKFNKFIDLRKYKVQYVPFITSNGRRKVYVNAFCDYNLNFDLIDWKKHLIQVYDGGSCFFHLIINLADNKFEDFYINGHG